MDFTEKILILHVGNTGKAEMWLTCMRMAYYYYKFTAL